jgi:hypothetical protein
VILACPAFDEVDQAALRLFTSLLPPLNGRVVELSANTLAGELVARGEKEEAAGFLLTAVAPAGLAHCRYLCKRLRAAYPDLKIIVGYWGSTTQREEDRRKLQSAGANAVASNMLETQNLLWPRSAAALVASKEMQTAAPVGSAR